MANTTNYGFNLIDDGANIHIQRDVNTPIEQIDAQMKSNADAVTTAIGDEHDATILREAAIVDDFNDALSDASTTMMVAVARRDEFAGKNIVMIGDSYTYGTGSATHSGVQRSGHKSTNDSARWSSLFCSKIGGVEYNFAFGATGFIRSQTSEAGYTAEDLRFIKQIEIAESEMTADEISNTALVVIAGGINDARHSADDNITGAQMQSAAQAACEAAKTAFPNALVMLIPMMWHTANWNETAYNFWMRLKLGGMQAGANVLVIDNAWTWLFGWVAWCTGIHPNADGHYKLAEFAISGLNGGNTMGISWDTLGLNGNPWHNYSDCYINFSNGMVSLLPCYVTGGLSAGTNVIGTVPAWAAPDTGRTNVYIPIVKGNAVVGTVGIVAGSGNMNAVVDSAVSSGFYLMGASWQPSGIMSS